MKLNKLSIKIPALLILLYIATTLFACTDFTNKNFSNSDIIILITYVLIALIFSFLCSVAEAVLLSITPSFIAGLQKSKPKLGALLVRLKQEKVDQSLAAILTLNTIAHTIGAIGAGAKATIVFGNKWIGIFSAVITLLILFLSEIIPKTLGALFWRKLAWFTAYFIRTLIILLYPLIWISDKLTKLITRKQNLHAFNREEFVALAGIGEKAGHLKKRESRIIRNLFRFDSLKAKDIMTPRTVISSLQEDLSVEEAMEAKINTPFSRIPIFKNSHDDISGFILKDELLLSQAKNQKSLKIKNLKRDIISVNSEMSLSGLLEFIFDKRQHIALVVDEFGGTQGLVSLEDVVETLLGMEIVDEMDKVDDMQAWARKQWSKRAKSLGIDPEQSQ